MRSASWLAVSALALGLGGLVLTAVRTRAAAPARSDLELDLHAVRYRHLAARTIDTETTATITALEARLNEPTASPFDMADLADLYLRRAKTTGDPKDHEAAEAMARRSLALLPEPNPALLTLAKLANTRHEFREAIDLARRHAKGTSYGPLMALAAAHLALGELDQASAAAEGAVAKRPDSAAYLMRALVMQAQGRDAEAAFDFTRAATVEEPGDVEESARLRTLWGRFLMRRGELANAKLLFEEALRIAPDFPLALAQQAELALRTGRAKEARALFEQAFVGSRQVRYLIDQARAHELAGELSRATTLRAQVEKLVRGELREGGLGHRLDLIEVLVDRAAPADLSEAVGLAREELARRGSAEVRFQLARALARSGGRDEALVQIQLVISNGARDARIYELAAQLETQRGNPIRATFYLRQADLLDPGASGWRKLGMSPR